MDRRCNETAAISEMRGGVSVFGVRHVQNSKPFKDVKSLAYDKNSKMIQ
jgi:hypothetical protein